jgi:hypothetical protein
LLIVITTIITTLAVGVCITVVPLAVALDVTSHHGVGRRSGLGSWYVHGCSTVWAAVVLFCGVSRCLLP